MAHRDRKGWKIKSVLFDPQSVEVWEFLKRKNPGGFELSQFVRRMLRAVAEKQGYKEEAIQRMTEAEMKEVDDI